MTTTRNQFKAILPSVGGALLVVALLLLCLQGKKPNLLGQNASGVQTTREEIELLIKMSNEYADEQDYEKALKSRAMAFKLNKNAGLYSYNDDRLTNGLEDKTFTKITLDTLKKAVNLLPKDLITADYLNTLANLVIAKINSDYAIELAQQALSLSSKSTDSLQQAAAYYNIGHSYYCQDNYKDAELYFKKSYDTYTAICDTVGMLTSGKYYGRSIGDLYRLNEAEKILKETVALARTYQNAELLFAALGCLRDLKWNQGDYKEAQHLEIEIREIALETRDTYNILVSKWDEGLTLQFMGNYREALPLFGAASKWDKDHHINIDLPQDYYVLASCFNGLGVYDSAVYYYQKGIQISTQFNNFYYLSHSLQDLALLNLEIDNNETAKEYIEKVNQIYREKGVEKYQPTTLANFYKWQATVLEKEGQLDSAIFYAKAYFDVLEKNDVIGEIPHAFNLLGKLYHQKGEIQLAKTHLLQALKMTKEIGLLAPQCETLMVLGEIAIREHAYPQAIQALNESLELAQSSNQNGLLTDIYQKLAQAQSQAGDFQSAYHHQAMYNSLKDSLLGIDRKTLIALYEAAFKAEEQELDNESLRAEKNQRNYNLQKRNLVIMALAAGIALIIVAAYLNRERVKYRTERKLRKNIARDIHDDVGSTLNDLKLTIKEALEEEAKDETTEKKLMSAIQLSNQAMISLDNLIWKLDSAEASLASFVAEVRAFTCEMLEAHQIPFQFEATGFESKQILPPATYRHLLLIYKEAIQNAIKHGDQKGINIQWAQAGGNLNLVVMNQIPSQKPSELGTNKGLLNMQARSSALKGDISFKKTADCFELRLSLTIKTQPKKSVPILSHLKRYGLMLLASSFAFASLSAQQLSELREAYKEAATVSSRIETLAKISDYYISQKNFRLALEYRARALKINEDKNIYRFDLPIFSDGIEKTFVDFPLEKLKSEVNNLPTDLQTSALLNLLANSAIQHDTYSFAQSLTNKALSLSKLTQNTLQEGVANYLTGYALYQNDYVTQAEPYLIEALRCFVAVHDDLYIVRAKRLLARTNKWLYRLKTAGKYASEAVSLSYSLDDEQELFESLTKLRDIKLWEGDFKEVFKIQEELFRMAKDKLPESEEWLMEVNSGEVIIFSTMGNYKKALDIQKKMVEWTETHQDSSMLPKEYYSLGLCYLGLSVYDTALVCFQKSMDFAKQTGNRYVIRQALTSLMKLFFEVGDKEAAMMYNRQLEAICAATDADEEQYFTKLKYSWKTLYFENTGVLDSAIYYAKESVHQAAKDSLLGELAENLAELGRLYILDGKLELAKSNLEKAFKTSNEIGQTMVACKSLLFLAQTALKEKDARSAIEYAHTSLERAEDNQITNLFNDLYKTLAYAYSENGDFAEAYHYQVLYDKLEDSLLVSVQRHQIAKYESLYKLKEKEVEYKRLQAEKKQKDYDIRKRNLVLLMLTIVIFLLTGSAYMIKERAKLQAERKLRKQITRDIHDDVGSTLNNIKMTIKEVIEKQPGNKATTSKLDRAVQLGNRATESLKNLIMRTEQGQTNLKHFLEEATIFTNEMLSLHQIPLLWQATGFNKKMPLPYPTYHHLMMVLKEAVHNAIKHGEKGSIEVRLTHQNRLILLSIKNKTPKSSHAMPSTIMGLQNMRDRIALLHGDIAFDKTTDYFEVRATVRLA